MPWQTEVVLTREIAVWRVSRDAKLLTPALLLGLMSMRVVHDQFKHLVLMQMNREDLGRRYRELLIPIPRTEGARIAWSAPIKSYLDAQAAARASYDRLGDELSPDLFADRP